MIYTSYIVFVFFVLVLLLKRFSTPISAKYFIKVFKIETIKIIIFNYSMYRIGYYYASVRTTTYLC